MVAEPCEMCLMPSHSSFPSVEIVIDHFEAHASSIIAHIHSLVGLQSCMRLVLLQHFFPDFFLVVPVDFTSSFTP
jgi:hypothetical protein